MKSRVEYSEQELLQQLKKGDHSAFEQLYNKYAYQLTAKLFKLLRDEELAGDVLQDLFLKIWERREDIDPGQSLGGYLYTIASNMAKNKFANALHRQIYFQSLPANEEGFDSVSRFVDQKEMKLAIDQALAKLPERQREIYTLYKIEGLSYKEIQVRAGISKPAVNRLIQEAGKKMREYLKPHSYIILCCVLIDVTH
ncbi:RNA polymerase sigma-70 factor [Sphingobacterium faecium NBRC 15299]|uniref:RNA polymerase sigma factor n=1 Tax=Sphingobacterium faecium TaxID=34087 RepID=UPI000D33ED88|nr:sigma-70 family RNA polymerase sigma factor [Sphingobacterium faecium]PTX09452.1 RNA polymerase sigma-70 factor (ECF subfamily) [Sphingobacterium faecium]GEM63922.1 RNA polymerase sigma-70 factor [Sphingobacterium faecium NBRC 15299]